MNNFQLECISCHQSDYDGRTALHVAVCENNESIVKFLIQIGKVNQMKKDRWNHTPKDEAETHHPHLLQYFQ